MILSWSTFLPKLAISENLRDARRFRRWHLWRDLLEFAFATESLRKLCINAQAAERQLGKRVAEKLRHRLADLRAAESVNDVPIGKPISMPTPGELGIDLGEHVLVFEPNHDPVPRTPTNEVDWTRVTRVQFLRVEAKSSQIGGPRG